MQKKNLAPNLDLSISSSVNKDNDSTNSYSLAYKQTIFDNKKIFYTVQTLEKTLLANKFDYLNTSSQIRYRLRTAFINLFYAQESLKLSENIVKIRKSNYELVKMKYSSGLENKGSLLLSEAQLLDAETAVEKAKLDIISMKKSLASTMGDVNFSSFTVKSSFDLTEDTNQEPNFQIVISSNPLLKSLEYEKDSKELNLKLESLKISPSLSVSASLGQNDNSFLSNKDLSHSLGINLSVPLFAGNIRKDKIKNANSSYMQASLNIAENKNEIIDSMQNCWTNLKESLLDVTTKKKFLEAYESRSEITQAKYSIGMITFDNWIIIEDNLISATKAYLDSQIQTLKKEAEWIQIKGGSLDYE